MTEKPLGVFISHIHEEAAVGAVIKDIVEDVFEREGLYAFLSSDKGDIPAGRKWLEEIGGQLDRASVIVSILSPTSLRRPWVNIELGAGWIKDGRVIPLCHSGLTADDLPRPFSDFSAVNLGDPKAAEQLLGGIADGFGLAHPRRLAFEGMLAELRSAANGIKIPDEVGAVTAQAYEPAADEIAILITLAKAANAGSPIADWDSLARESGVNFAPLTHHVDQLQSLGLARIDYDYLGSKLISLTPPGSKWLMDRKLMPK